MAQKKKNTKKIPPKSVSSASAVVRSSTWSDEWYARVLAVAETVGHPICGAKNRKGTPCRRKPAADTDNGRCKLHGAHGGRPPTHGRYMRYPTLSAETLAEYGHFLEDPDIASLDEEIVLTRMAISQALKEREKWAAVFDDEELIELISSSEYPETFDRRDGQLTAEHKKFMRKLNRAQRVAASIYKSSIVMSMSIERLRKLIDTREKRRRQGYVARDDVVTEFGLHFGAFFRCLESQMGTTLTSKVFGVILQGYVREVGAPAETVVDIAASTTDAGRALVEVWRAMKEEKDEKEPE